MSEFLVGPGSDYKVKVTSNCPEAKTRAVSATFNLTAGLAYRVIVYESAEGAMLVKQVIREHGGL